MANQTKAITLGATTEILCFTLNTKAYEKVTIRCLSSVAGTLKTIYKFGKINNWKQTHADDTSTAVAAHATFATRSMLDADGNSISVLRTATTGLVTQVFDYRLGTTLVTFTPDSSTAGTLYIEALSSKAGEK